MEQKSAEFRARRQAEKGMKKCEPAAPQPREQKAGHPGVQSESSQQPEEPESHQTAISSPPSRDSRDWSLDSASGRWLASRQSVLSNVSSLKVSSWSVSSGLFVESEFGSPFFVVSSFYWIYEGSRSPEARKPGESSAYSVFNPDCQPLLGSLTAEQSEGEMGYRPSANR